MRTEFRSSRATLLVAPLLFTFSLGVQQASLAQEHVVIKGRSIVPSHLSSPLQLTLVVGDSVCIWVKLKGGGRFEIASDQDQRYLLRFEQVGSVTKVVQVDTRFAERKPGKKKRSIAFDVLMEPLDASQRFSYKGPVGRIDFHRSNGRMEVEKDYARETQSVVVLEEMP